MSEENKKQNKRTIVSFEPGTPRREVVYDPDISNKKYVVQQISN